MAEGLTGSLAQWPLPDILNLLCSSRQVGRIELTDGPHRADVYIREGAVVHATSGTQSGEPVIATVMTWAKGTFSFEPRVPTSQVTVIRPLADVLQDAAAEVTERAKIRDTIASAHIVPRLVATIANAVTIQPADWSVLAFCDGRASIGDVTDALHEDEWDVTRRFYRLSTSGLVEFEEPLARPVLQFAPPTAQQSAPAAPAASAGPPKVIVSPQFFKELTAHAAQALGPLAPVIVDDGVDLLKSTRESFAKEKASQLVEFVAGEIADDAQRVKFQQAMLQWLRSAA